MYYITFAFLLIGAIREVLTHKKSNFFFYGGFWLLVLMLTFRYGQGTDYFNYEGIYNSLASYDSWSWSMLLIGLDPAYTILSYVANRIGLDFEFFINFLALCMLFMFFPFLKRKCEKAVLALFVFYIAIFMIYELSAIRQGLAMGLFVCFMFEKLMNRKWLGYYLIGLLALTFHASAFIFFFLPLFCNMKLQNSNTILVILLICTLICFIGAKFISFLPINYIRSRIENYNTAPDVGLSITRFFAILSRAVIVGILVLMQKKYYKKSQVLAASRQLLIIGFILYSIFGFSDLIASRLWGYFLPFICVLVSGFYKLHYDRLVRPIMITLLYGLFWFKDLGAAIEQGNYEHCTVFNYPYFSVFDTQQDILHYRKRLKTF